MVRRATCFIEIGIIESRKFRGFDMKCPLCNRCT